MGALERSDKQKVITNAMFIGMFLAILLFVIMIFWQASAITPFRTFVTKIVHIGPLKMVELTKQPINDGYRAKVQLLPGLLVYFVLWIVISGAFGYLRLHKTHDEK